MSIVTISRGSYSGAKAIAVAVARTLGVPCISREVILEAAQSAGITEGKLSELLERPPSFFERVSRERDTYMVFIRAALHQHAADGSFVYHGHDGHLLLTELPHVLRIRVVAPLDMRVEAVTERLGLDDRQARRHIAKIDGYRAKWTRFLHGVDWADPQLYDLVVNLERVDVEQATTLVSDMARSGRFASTDALRRRATNLALTAHVWAEVARVSEARGAELEIETEDGVVVLRGSVRTDGLRTSITEAAERAPGVEEVRCEIEIPSDVFKA